MDLPVNSVKPICLYIAVVSCHATMCGRWIPSSTNIIKPTEIQSDSCYFKPSSFHLTNILLSGHLGSGYCFPINISHLLLLHQILHWLIYHICMLRNISHKCQLHYMYHTCIYIYISKSIYTYIYI